MRITEYGEKRNDSRLELRKLGPHTKYAHTKPHANVEAGMIVKEGDIIASFADTSHSKANIIPHLHFSLGRASKSFSYDRSVWNIIREPEKIILFIYTQRLSKLRIRPLNR